jgi:hypothetical protein
MFTVTLKSPKPYQTFGTTAGDRTSDENREIPAIDINSQLCRDLIGAGCQIVDGSGVDSDVAPAPITALGDPTE